MGYDVLIYTPIASGSIFPRTMDLSGTINYILRYTNLFCQTSITYDSRRDKYVPKKFPYLRIVIFWACTIFVASSYVIIGGQILRQFSIMEFVIRVLGALAFVTANIFSVFNGIDCNATMVEMFNHVLKIEKDLSSQFDHKFDYGNLNRCIRSAIGFAIFYYSVLVSGLFLVNNILVNDYSKIVPFVLMSVLTVPVIGQSVPLITIMWLLRRQLMFLRKTIECSLKMQCCYEDVLICLDFLSRFNRLVSLVSKCFGRSLIMIALFSLVMGSLHFYSLLDYVSAAVKRSLADHLFVISTSMWLLSIQFQFVLEVIAVQSTTDQVNN